MRLTVNRLTELARSVAREYDDAIQVIGIVSSNPGANRIELLVTLAGCHDDDCRLMVNVGRGPEATFVEEIRAALRRAFDDHRAH